METDCAWIHAHCNQVPVLHQRRPLQNKLSAKQVQLPIGGGRAYRPENLGWRSWRSPPSPMQWGRPPPPRESHKNVDTAIKPRKSEMTEPRHKNLAPISPNHNPRCLVIGRKCQKFWKLLPKTLTCKGKNRAVMRQWWGKQRFFYNLGRGGQTHPKGVKEDQFGGQIWVQKFGALRQK